MLGFLGLFTFFREHLSLLLILLISEVFIGDLDLRDNVTGMFAVFLSVKNT